jgi:DME family drug/metabolite transporter
MSGGVIRDKLELAGGGAIFVALAAGMWGSDAVFRRGLALELPATTVVFAEHAILVGLMLPVLWRTRPILAKLQRDEWMALVLIGVGASALATILFTKAFSYGDPTTPLILQKLQPMFAVAGAYLLLKERLMPRYVLYLGAAVVGAYLITFPSPTLPTFDSFMAAALAVSAAALWGFGTVLGRKVLPTVPFVLLTALRFAIGLPAASIAMWLQDGQAGLRVIGTEELLALLLLALVPGLGALLIYYAGLRHTPASAATIAELAFPLSAITLNWLVFGATLTSTQWLGVATLSAAITTLGYVARKGSSRAGIVIQDEIGSPGYREGLSSSV